MFMRFVAAVAIVVAGAEMSIAQNASATSENPTLFKLRGDACAEDYAAELRSVGIKVAIRELDRLDGVAKAAGLPKTILPKHIFFVGGFVVANHVPPAAVMNLLKDRPKANGIIGSSACASAKNHNEIHSANISIF